MIFRLFSASCWCLAFILGAHHQFAASFQLLATPHIAHCHQTVLVPLRFSTSETDDIQTSNHHDAKEVSASILEAMRQRTTPTPGSLHLAHDLYDESTGLHSEGVWHNALAGITCLKLSQCDAAHRIANSLWKYSWDGVSFRRRAYSGNWNHTILETPNAIEQPNYYKESCEHRCVQHGMALILWTQLVLSSMNNDTLKEQQRIVATAFLDEYWNEDENKWTTIGFSQGGGTVFRPSASAAKVTLGVTQDEPYYRAVDQAIGILACLACLDVLEQSSDDHIEMYRHIVDIIQRSCNTLLNCFGYEDEESIRTYLGLDRNRNFWHDGWSMLALTMARQHSWLNNPTQCEQELQLLFSKLLQRYGHVDSNDDFDGTVWHWPHASKSNADNERYCGDNALLYAICRNSSPTQWNKGGFWDFVDLLRSREEDGLASVADVYEQVRLHPNTELAALLVWP